jgi:hypothetical protein
VNYWKVIVATVVIFGAGVFTGGLLVNYIHQSHVRNGESHHPPTPPAGSNSVAGLLPNPPRLPEVLSKPFLPKLDDLLHLSSDQHKAIEKIISDAQGQMHKVTQDTRMAIRGALTPDQRSQFDDLMKRQVKKPAGATNGVENGSSSNSPKAAGQEPALTNAAGGR